ncbi:hypothetical protein FE783_11480 [Paenibacillus mesophilus]|uniref:hypothetical protein n=1 Tax=Paenibacillus mesophilus TaxID=2582849 RepID=UPI00110DE59E|nr:hypothetical protein [Paenibacillus mesophilus]TMV50176.1 hypothetical protein FE783_11480 [Paenibacillus mesophilus]
MFGFMLFLHLTGLMVWLGALLAVVIVVPLLRKQPGAAESNALASRIIRIFGMLAHPAAVVVLLSGVFMIVKMGIGPDKPLWLDLMEKGGGTIILLALVLTGLLGRKARKRLGAAEGRPVALSGYLTASAGFMVLIVSMVLLVSLKI